MSGVRQPRLQVLLDGVALDNVLSAELRASGTLQADRFRIEAAPGPDGLARWDPGAALQVEIRLGLDGAAVASLLRGAVDLVRADPVTGRVVAEGRDLSARLIDARTGESFANQTASEVATLLAGRHGLRAAVQRTATPVGRYYQADHTHVALGRFARARSEWDLLADLARREGMALYVEGETLHFAPAEETSPFQVAWQAGRANVESLSLQVLPAIARGVRVVVRSWHSKEGRGITASAGTAGGAVADLLRPNLTADAAAALAEATRAELAGQARRIGFALPGELTLTPRRRVRLDAPPGWAGLYAVTEVVRRLDQANGFRQSVLAQRIEEAA